LQFERSRIAFSLAVALGAAPLLGGCWDAPPAPLEVHPIRLDSVGYFPERAKIATVTAPGGGTFYVRRAADGGSLWSSQLSGPMPDTVDGSQVWIADFTTFCDQGEFYLEVPGVGKSSTFRVAPGVYDVPFIRAMQGLSGQRCGSAVEIDVDTTKWSHRECHMKDAYLTYLDGMNSIEPSLGGWHDAGDYGKYVITGAFTVGMLFSAWQLFQPALAAVSLPIPEHGGKYPDFLAEVKWELDWLFTTQQSDGGVSHKVTATNFETFLMPERDNQQRFYVSVGTSATGYFVAVMAAAARTYAPYDADYAAKALAAAQLGYTYLAANPNQVVPNQMGFHTGPYTDNGDADKRLWAAAELYETTGDPAVLADLETRLAGNVGVPENFDWGEIHNLGIFTYLLSKRPERNPDLVARLTTVLMSAAGDIVTRSAAQAYGRGVANYYPGSNGVALRTSMILAVANALVPDTRYLDTIVAQVDHVFGRNAYDRSQVTGLGYNPPIHPHHRPSASDGIADPWPGLLVGGQDQSTNYDWVDNQNNSRVNEVAINWNGALIFALAGFLSFSTQ